jgi:hypothetical protein
MRENYALLDIERFLELRIEQYQFLLKDSDIKVTDLTPSFRFYFYQTVAFGEVDKLICRAYNDLLLHEIDKFNLKTYHEAIQRHIAETTQISSSVYSSYLTLYPDSAAAQNLMNLASLFAYQISFDLFKTYFQIQNESY